VGGTCSGSAPAPRGTCSGGQTPTLDTWREGSRFPLRGVCPYLFDLDTEGASRSRPPLFLKGRVGHFEQGLFEEELARCQGNRSEAARRLGMSRVILLDKLKKYGINGDSTTGNLHLRFREMI